MECVNITSAAVRFKLLELIANLSTRLTGMVKEVNKLGQAITGLEKEFGGFLIKVDDREAKFCDSPLLPPRQVV